MNIGFFIGLIDSFLVSVHNYQIRSLSKSDPYYLNLVRHLVAVLIMALSVSIFSYWSIPESSIFWFLAILTTVSEAALAFCYVKAFQLSPQSIVGPLSSLSAIPLIPAAFIFLGEVPNMQGLIGISLAIIGTLLLGWDFSDSGVKKAFLRLINEKGTYFILLTILLGVISTVAAKFSYKFVSPIIFVFYITLGQVFLYLFLILSSRRKIEVDLSKNMILTGVSFGLVQILHYIGISLMLAAYFISIKRISVVFDVILGRYLGKEQRFRERLIGSVIILISLVIILLS